MKNQSDLFVVERQDGEWVSALDGADYSVFHTLAEAQYGLDAEADQGPKTDSYEIVRFVRVSPKAAEAPGGQRAEGCSCGSHDLAPLYHHPKCALAPTAPSAEAPGGQDARELIIKIHEICDDYTAAPTLSKHTGLGVVTIVEDLCQKYLAAPAAPSERADLKHAVSCMDRSCKRCNKLQKKLAGLSSQEGE